MHEPDPWRSPRLSVIICTFNMAREAPRTILSAGVPYQKDVAPEDYEVIVVDNGSTTPQRIDPGVVPPRATLVDMPDAQPSPVFAMNWAARNLARGEILLFAIDGARIFSDRLYAATIAAHELISDAFVYTPAWHLGPKVQMISTREGYDEAVENRLIARSGWPDRPAGLFEVSVLAGSSSDGFFQPIRESNAFSVRRDLFDVVGGYDEGFVLPGGGLCNLEIFSRYVTRPDAQNICLLSEGTFHQVHGGVATSGSPDQWSVFNAEYGRVVGHPYRRPVYETTYFGCVRPEATRCLARPAR